MADEYKFPDEVAAEKKPEVKTNEPQLEVVVVDDTPAEDRGRKPLGKEPDEVAPDDEARKYSEDVQKRIGELKHIAHDERRAREAALREREEAVNFAKLQFEENKRLRGYISGGEKQYKDTLTAAASTELGMAKKALKAAYESGDAEKVAEAAEQLNAAQIRAVIAQQFTPSAPPSQEEKFPVQSQQTTPARPRVDEKALRWQARNQWFGQDPEMTSFALGLHQKLVEAGINPDTEDYYQKVDGRLRQVFPDFFGERQQTNGSEPQRTTATVVAPAGRTSAQTSRKITLSVSQQNLARKLGLSNAQYAEQVARLQEKQ